MTDMHIVRKGDTLSKISKKYSVSVSELQNINELPNSNRLEIGQVISLKKENVLGVQVLFLDKDRNPIKEITYFLEYAGRTIRGMTGADGLTKKIMTITPQDDVRIFIERVDESLKEIGKVVSGYGNKLVTLVSPAVKVEAKTEKHPDLKRGEYPNKKEKVNPAYDPKSKQAPTTNKEGLGKKVTLGKSQDGKPLAIVEGDIPDLNGFLDEYNGEAMAEDDYAWAAKELDVEKAAIKAFAVVESAGAGFFKMGTRQVPKILYERHKFSKKTNHRYSANYPDISLPSAYYNSKAKYVLADATYKKTNGIPSDVEFYRPIRKKDSKKTKESAVTLKELLETGKTTTDKDKYAVGVGSYKRLVKAYQLDQNAALESCSWGAFQIMGEYWKIMGYASQKDFTRAVSRSPKEQIKTFVLYIKHVNPGIKKHLKANDWAAVAKAYNGRGYKENDYDVKLEAAYKKFSKE